MEIQEKKIKPQHPLTDLEKDLFASIVAQREELVDLLQKMAKIASG
jgi:hypothetical protein